MKKIIIIVAFLLGFTALNAQSYTFIAQRYEWLAGTFRALGLPAGDGPAAFQPGQRVRAGAVYYDSAGVDAGFYIWDGLAWGLVTGGVANNIYTADGTLAGNRTVNLNGNIFSLISGGEYFIYLDPTPGAETSFFQAYNQTGNDNFAQLANSATNTSAQSLMVASFNASKQAFVILNASSGVSLANIIADSAKLEINRTVPVSIADSALHWMMVMDRTTGVLRPAHWPAGGGGSGTDNANAGAFYRWLKTGTQNIKTLAAGYGVLIDSTTNTDALTATVDSSVIASKTYVDNSVSNKVTGVSVATANGFAGTATATTTPVITLSATPNGILRSDGTSMTNVKLGNDFLSVADSLFMYSWNTPLRYLGVGNGSTNDQAALQAACNAAKAVFIPPGYNFRVTTSVNMQAGQTMFGVGDKSIISCIANTRAVVLDSNCRVTGIKFLGNGKAGSGVFNTGVMATAAVGWSIDNCIFQDFAGDPTQNGGGGVYVAALGSANTNGGKVYANYFISNDGGLVFASRGEYVAAYGNNFGSNTVAILKGAGNLTITNNILEGNTTGIKSITGTNVAHSIVANNIINHNGFPYWIEDVTYDLGDIYTGNEVYYGSIKIINSQNLRFVNETWGILDSVFLNNAKAISRTSCWMGLTQANTRIPVRRYGGAEEFDQIAEKRTRYDSLTTWIKQVSYTDTAFDLRGPMYHTGVTAASSSSSDSVWVKSSTGLWKLRAQSDISGGGGANTALSNLASVLVNVDLDPGSNNSRDIGDGTTSWKDIYAYNFNVRNGSGSGLHTSYTNYSGTPSNGLPPSTGFFVNRVSTGEASNATPTPTGDGLTNFYQLTALAANATFQTPSGSVIGEHNLLWLIIEDNGTPRTLSFNGSYVAGSDIPLPTTTVAGESMELQFRCHGGTIWRLVGRTGGF